MLFSRQNRVQQPSGTDKSWALWSLLGRPKNCTGPHWEWVAADAWSLVAIYSLRGLFPSLGQH